MKLYFGETNEPNRLPLRYVLKIHNDEFIIQKEVLSKTNGWIEVRNGDMPIVYFRENIKLLQEFIKTFEKANRLVALK